MLVKICALDKDYKSRAAAWTGYCLHSYFLILGWQKSMETSEYGMAAQTPRNDTV